MGKKSGLSKDVSSILNEAPEESLRKKQVEDSSLLKETSAGTVSLKASARAGYRKATKVLGIDISEKSVKAAWFSKGVLRVAMRELPPDLSGDEWFGAVTDAVRKILRENGVRGRRANCTVSGSSIFFRQMKLPQMGREELKKTIAWEMKRSLAGSAKDMVLDFVILRETAERGINKEEILVAGMKADHLSRLVFSLRRSGVELLEVNMVPFSLFNAFRGTEDTKDAAALLDVGAKETTVAIVKGASLFFVRQVQIGGDDFTKALAGHFSLSIRQAECLKREKDIFSPQSEEFPVVRPVLERFQRELERSLSHFAAGGEHAGKILLSGGGGKLKGFDTYLSEKTGLPAKTIGQLDPQFVTAAGAVFSKTGGINLLSPRIETVEKLKARARNVLAAGVLVLVAIYGGLLGVEAHLKARLREEKLRVLDSKPLVREARRTIALRELTGKRSPCLEVLRELRTLIPEGVWVTGLEFSEGCRLRVEGRALSNVGVTRFLGKLEGSKSISKSNLDSIRRMRTTAREIVVFEIDCVMRQTRKYRGT